MPSRNLTHAVAILASAPAFALRALLELGRSADQIDRLVADGDRGRAKRDRNSGHASLIGRPKFTFSAAQIGGAVGYALTVALFVFATRMTTAANAIFLQYTAPIYVALIGRWYLGERAHAFDWVVIVVALFGIALFFVDRLTIAGFWGNIVALGSGIAFASVALFLRKERSGSPVASIILGNVIVALAGIPFMLRGSLGEGGCWRLLLLGALQLGLPYVFYGTAIKYVTALEATLIPLLEPVLNPLWVMLALGERPGPWAVLGGALVLGAVLARGALMVRARRAPVVTR